MPVPPSRPSPRSGSFALFSLAGLAGTVAIAGGGLWASWRAGETEAMADVRASTAAVANAVVEPSLSSELLAGDEAALVALDTVVTGQVLDGRTLRVKLWSADGTILYSDEPRLIGEVHALDEDKVASLASGAVVSGISSLDGPENRFDTDLADRMLEVYLPIEGPGGERLLYESYFAYSPVAESAARIRGTFLPVVLVPLGLMLTLHLGLAWALTRRLHRHQAERERLLRRAVESSDLERRRIAADLHDGVVQDLVGTSLAVTAAAGSAAGHPELVRELRAAAATTRRSLQSLRSLLVDVYPVDLDRQGLESAVTDLLAPAADLGIEAELSVHGPIEDWSPDRASLVYRVVRESVRNVYRHAGATRLAVEIDAGQPAGVAVSDNGTGLAGLAPGDGHLGLRLLADLCADADARFTVASDPGAGTTIRLEVGP